MPKLVLGAGDSGLSVSRLYSAAKPKNEGAREAPERRVHCAFRDARDWWRSLNPGAFRGAGSPAATPQLPHRQGGTATGPVPGAPERSSLGAGPRVPLEGGGGEARPPERRHAHAETRGPWPFTFHPGSAPAAAGEAAAEGPYPADTIGEGPTEAVGEVTGKLLREGGARRAPLLGDRSLRGAGPAAAGCVRPPARGKGFFTAFHGVRGGGDNAARGCKALREEQEAEARLHAGGDGHPSAPRAPREGQAGPANPGAR